MNDEELKQVQRQLIAAGESSERSIDAISLSDWPYSVCYKGATSDYHVYIFFDKDNPKQFFFHYLRRLSCS